MPQPIRSPKIIHFNFDPTAALSLPDLAAHVVVISGIWNEMEARIGLFVAVLLSADPKTGASMFLAITNDGAKRAALDAVCSAKLSTTDNTTFQAILKTIGLLYGERNRMVHGVWGVGEAYPDKLIWGDIRDAVGFHADMIGLMGEDLNDARYDRIMAYQKDLFSYDKRDFEQIIVRFSKAYKELKDFTQPFVTKAFGTPVLRLPTRPAKPPRGSPVKPGPSAS